MPINQQFFLNQIVSRFFVFSDCLFTISSSFLARRNIYTGSYFRIHVFSKYRNERQIFLKSEGITKEDIFREQNFLLFHLYFRLDKEILINKLLGLFVVSSPGSTEQLQKQKTGRKDNQVGGYSDSNLKINRVKLKAKLGLN